MKKTALTCLGIGVIYAALVLPNHPDRMTWQAFDRFPLELPVILLFALVMGRYWVVPALLSFILIGSTLLKCADVAMFTAYNRTFNPILDVFLIDAGIGLLGDSIGTLQAYGVLVCAAVVICVLWLAFFLTLRAIGRIQIPHLGRGVALAGVLGFGAWAVGDAGHHLNHWTLDRSPAGTTWTSRLVLKRATDMQATALDLAQFRREAQEDIYADTTGLLDRLYGRDVIFIYIESYGRASFDNALYAQTHTNTLATAAGRIEETGLAIKSGWLTSPTAGGQSWLAHGTLSTGLWASDQGRYAALLASGHKSLFHIAQDAGFRTAAIMPAITLAWPESSAMGFDQVFAAADIPYGGAAFNWVTMPDQFTLATYRDLLPDDPRADFLQIALISSHAPWVPVPDMVAWEAVGDGTVFNAMAARGPTPRVLWQNRDDVRDAYRRAVDYALQATFSHIARLGEAAPLVIVVGDHQPAGFVAGSDNRDVPVHMIGPPDLIGLIDRWGWSDGLIPASNVPVRRMDTFRNDFIRAFTRPVQLTQAHE